MAEFTELKNQFKNANRLFSDGVNELRKKFQEHQNQETGTVQLSNGYLNDFPSDFGLHYCLSETIEQVERCIKEKPSREMALVKTKLQEALYWASQS